MATKKTKQPDPGKRIEVRVKRPVRLETGTVLRPKMRVWLKPHMIEKLGEAVEKV